MIRCALCRALQLCRFVV
ncbi:hypothetical protein E3O57_00545 [Cryobacterium sp. TMN-39-2]|nr:hypothetical protein E3O57_00545 [Cryobacterium sp. TMN-39-2]TFC57029.1 hypothetical protein E3O68_03025 [Cryobacterium sp. TMB3-1-2]TFC60124.1 hypothetical protein E3O60_07400 [Cryobacterium sp. TMB1-7]TFC67988.1 hypothetical protein E3T21_15825 [Cryobacterium sp. TMB3-15]TFC76907.1 hypothetical protein E3T22_07735 [Cryobacterium sp. TMB3-10]TFC91505.1 hypothetical protein E3T19_04060 [Cryobacterium sp. TMT4-31]TFD42322.1 hypothetical protein E3T58_09320 [Cryobacterium sp. TMB3-12]